MLTELQRRNYRIIKWQDIVFMFVFSLPNPASQMSSLWTYRSCYSKPWRILYLNFTYLWGLPQSFHLKITPCPPSALFLPFTAYISVWHVPSDTLHTWFVGLSISLSLNINSMNAWEFSLFLLLPLPLPLPCVLPHTQNRIWPKISINITWMNEGMNQRCSLWLLTKKSSLFVFAALCEAK